MTKAKVTKKKPVKKKPPTIVSYGIKMVIPTVQYGNIQPEIIVKANSLEEAHDFIVPHMNKLWKEYYLVNGKRPEPTPPAPIITPVPTPYIPPQDTTGDPIPPNPIVTASTTTASTPIPSPISSVALVKATSAVESCMSKEALELIITQVYASVKLTDEDKATLAPLIDIKSKQFNG